MMRIIWWALLDLLYLRRRESDVARDIRMSIREVATGQYRPAMTLEEWMVEAREWEKAALRLGVNP